MFAALLAANFIWQVIICAPPGAFLVHHLHRVPCTMQGLCDILEGHMLCGCQGGEGWPIRMKVAPWDFCGMTDSYWARRKKRITTNYVYQHWDMCRGLICDLKLHFNLRPTILMSFTICTDYRLGTAMHPVKEHFQFETLYLWLNRCMILNCRTSICILYRTVTSA